MMPSMSKSLLNAFASCAIPVQHTKRKGMRFPPEITKALVEKGLCASIVNAEPLSGGSINEAYHVEADQGHHLFVKINVGPGSLQMFSSESESLHALSGAVPSFSPTPLLFSALPEHGEHAAFLVTTFVPLTSRYSRSEAQIALGRNLAKLHDTVSPTGKFGFHVNTMCGSTEQDNEWTDSWEEFFKERRLRRLAQMCQKKWGNDKEMEKLIEQVCDKVVPMVIGCLTEIKPVLLHGDLWSGNWGVDGNTGQPVIHDPSSYYGHNEMELGIMNMFGGFDSFYAEYHKHHPKMEPYFNERVALYELYHHLNHWYMFGGGYKDGAAQIMRDLVQKL